MKKTKPKPKQKRRLSNIQISEVSLVGTPAVPQARFVIAKRDADAAEQSAGDEIAMALLLPDLERLHVGLLQVQVAQTGLRLAALKYQRAQ